MIKNILKKIGLGLLALIPIVGMIVGLFVQKKQNDKLKSEVLKLETQNSSLKKTTKVAVELVEKQAATNEKTKPFEEKLKEIHKIPKEERTEKDYEDRFKTLNDIADSIFDD